MKIFHYIKIIPFFFSITIMCCGSGSPPGHQEDADVAIDLSEIDRGDYFDFSSEAQEGMESEAIEEWLIQTQVNTHNPKAGEPVTVTCIPAGTLGQVKTEIIVTLDPDNPGGSLESVIIEGNVVKITKTGDYLFACKVKDTDIIDKTPEPVFVEPDKPASVETKVSKNEIKAGEAISVSCSVSDAYGNDIEIETMPVVLPVADFEISGTLIKFISLGIYDVACMIVSTKMIDLTPEKVIVTANVPKKIYTILTPEKIVAGKKSKVTCKVTDFYGNEIPISKFKVTISKPPSLDLLAWDLTTKIAGIYAVKCVPQDFDWDLFELHGKTLVVLPDKPVKMVLKVDPKKLYYGIGEQINVTYTVYDQYDNIIPDLILDPVKIDPEDGGVTASKEKPFEIFNFNSEGIYKLTFRLHDFPEISGDVTIKIEGSGPIITIYFPGRGETLTGKPAVTVTGKINETVSGIKTFTINGMPVKNIQLDGSFSHVVNAAQGMNNLIFEAENEAGFKSDTTRAFYYSTKYYPVDAGNPENGIVPDSIRTFINCNFIDDGDHNPNKPDDIATIIEMYIKTLDINSMIPSPVASAGPYKVYIKNISYGAPKIQLSCFDGGIHLYGYIPDFHADVDLPGKCKVLGIDFCPDFSGDISVDLFTINADIFVSMGANKQINVSMGNVDAKVNQLNVNVDGILGWLLGWLIDIIVDQFTGMIEQTIEAQLQGQFESVIKDLLQNLAINQEFKIPAFFEGAQETTLYIFSRPSFLKVTYLGINMFLEGTIYSAKKITHKVLGSIGRGAFGCESSQGFELPKTKEIELALWDDLINEAVFSIWNAGSLNIHLTKDQLSTVDLEQYGIKDLDVSLDFYLPPILTDCNSKKQLTAQIGDMYVDAKLSFMDMPMEFGLFASVEAQANIKKSVNKEGITEIGVELLGITKFIVEIVSINQELEGAKDALEQMIKDKLLGSLMETLAGAAFGSFPLPEIDMSSLSPSIPPGTVLKINIDELYRTKGFTVIQGHL